MACEAACIKHACMAAYMHVILPSVRCCDVASVLLPRCAHVLSVVALRRLYEAAAGRPGACLQRVPSHSKQCLQAKLQASRAAKCATIVQVGTVTAICTVAFVSRATLITLATIDSADFELDLLQHPLLNIFYYSAVEVVPSALVLYILRKLPPKRTPVYTAPDLEGQ